MIENSNHHRKASGNQDINGIRVYRSKGTDNLPAHWHAEAEIIMPVIGDYSVQVGRNESALTLEPGDILIIFPSQMHSSSGPVTGERFIFNLDFNSFLNLNGIHIFTNTVQTYSIIRKSEHTQLAKKLAQYLTDIVQEYNQNDIFCEAAIQSLLTCFLVAWGRQSFSEHESKLHSSQARLSYVQKFADACSYINQHCTEQLKMDDIAAYIGFSKYHFCRLFKDFVGCTYYDYLVSCRISHAQRLLSTSSISITDSALQSGFSSLTTFNRAFKIKTNCTPSEYRKLQQKDSNSDNWAAAVG